MCQATPTPRRVRQVRVQARQQAAAKVVDVDSATVEAATATAYTRVEIGTHPPTPRARTPCGVAARRKSGRCGLDGGILDFACAITQA
jgi:hypothetical protein